MTGKKKKDNKDFNESMDPRGHRREMVETEMHM